jgi:hypothetical protein
MGGGNAPHPVGPVSYRGDSIYPDRVLTQAEREYVEHMRAEYERAVAALIQTVRERLAEMHPSTCLCDACLTAGQRYLDWKDKQRTWS